ncbi:MAG: glycosyl transferase [Candidatus Eisenbacteria bacterium]
MKDDDRGTPTPVDSPFPAGAAPPGIVLSNGRYRVEIDGSGAGRSVSDGIDLTRGSDDPIDRSFGLFFYVRDRETGKFHSIGASPLPGAPELCRASRKPGLVLFERMEDGLRSRVEIAVPPEDTVEIRLVTIQNPTDRPRSLDLTTYAEVVIAPRESDAAHPAFSKLFVETGFDPGRQTLLANRRPRAKDENRPWLFHALRGEGDLQWETDRLRFLGRGGTPAAPAALSDGSPLSGTVGAVLDPVVALRRIFTLAPEEEVRFVAILGAAPSREEAIAASARWSSESATKRALESAEVRGPEAVEETSFESAPAGTPEVIGPATGDEATPRREERPLRFDNGYGGFNDEGNEYVIRLRHEPGRGLRLPPLPWVNVVANDRLGFLVSETGAGCTWGGNSREHRLSPWSNDPVRDPHDEAIYIRDEETGAFWSPLPGPSPAKAGYEARHGFGYSLFRHESGGLEEATCLFAPLSDPVKITRLRVTNRSDRTRRLSIVSYRRLVLGVSPETSGRSVVTEIDPETGALFARNPRSRDFAKSVTFGAAVLPGKEDALHLSGDRRAFLGPRGNAARPEALTRSGPIEGPVGARLDPAFVERAVIDIAPGECAECSFLFGEGKDDEEARTLVARYRRRGAVEEALAGVTAEWKRLRSGLRIATPRPALDIMVNGWLPYQTLACRMRGRTAFYQSGGAFGFRDQLQDAASLVYQAPEMTRAQILLHAAHQFVEGDVLHWWHPPRSRGIRTRFADDLLWLPYVTAFYVRCTGDRSIMNEEVRFLTARALAPGEDEAFLEPADSGEEADLYEHCCRALDRSLGTGAHGLPLFGTGDWNDGMNRVGREGRGESVWMAFFLIHLIDGFLPIVRERGDRERMERYEGAAKNLRKSVNDGGWDGGWYRRGYYDDGAPLGSKESDECKIDALVQAWSVISGGAPRERAERAMDGAVRELVSEEDGIIRLLTPAFDKTPRDPGYIKGYVPGVRENGGQYTHAALWVVRALAELGRNEKAARLLEMLTPVAHGGTAEGIETYKVEPYVVAADVYGEPPHIGRGGWTWYTGSSAWMFRVAVESILGIRMEDGNLIRIRPCIPDQWPRYDVTWRVPGEETIYEIAVENPRRRARSVIEATLDGAPLLIQDGAAPVPIIRDGRTHRVLVTLG